MVYVLAVRAGAVIAVRRFPWLLVGYSIAAAATISTALGVLGVAPSLVPGALRKMMPGYEDLSHCNTYEPRWGSVVTECHYPNSFGPFPDELRTAVGATMMAGPWATEDDIINPSLIALAGKRTVALNLELHGMGIVVQDTNVGMVMNNVLILGDIPDSAVEIRRMERQ